MSDWEEQIGEYANTVITLTSDGDGVEVAAFLGRLELREVQAVTVAIAVALLQQESVNEHLSERNAVIEGGNIALFRERRVLTDKVAELRSIIDSAAARSTAKRVKKVAA